eukprot:3228390-Alexandrium_andersonii.AAC.1
MGYCFLTKDASETSLTVLALKDRDSCAILAHPVLRKGRRREGTVDQALSSVRRLGHRRKVPVSYTHLRAHETSAHL